MAGVCIDAGRLLCVRDAATPDGPLGLPGGGLDHGRRMEDQLALEVAEETTVRMVAARYLFVIENRIPVAGGGMAHQIEHCFALTLDGDDVRSREDHIRFEWVRVTDLDQVDFRPRVLRDVISAGELDRHRHLVQPFEAPGN